MRLTEELESLLIVVFVDVKLADFSIDHPELKRHFPERDTKPRLNGRTNVIYNPPRSEREGNKSVNLRTLPLDDELRRLLVWYLLVRPDYGQPWFFLSNYYQKLDNNTVNREWKTEFHPQYAETEQHRAIGSHFGRHWFSTYWEVHQDVNRELVQYMRGDEIGNRMVSGQEVIGQYLHTYYEDIEDLYRERIFKLNF